MDKRSRAWKLYKKGLEHWNEGESPLLAIAVMLDAATAKGKSATPLHDADAVSFVDTLLQVAGDTIDSDPFDKKWYKLAEWRMREVEEMTVDSAFVVGEYLALGGWKGKQPPTVAQVINYFPDLYRNAQEQGTVDPRYNV